ncbi:CAAX prenyl protease-related protein [Methylobacillus caricis]|uniref:CAAX prenyl protease-related protein n=1 Tax=Methylobacillus caricis TaxID=1971611 RepID=UPI001CFFDBB6|nr:CAAX prenyl protease-related protein [Methylobacillus caricis]MCB5188089.1 CAAX prenyl protease-related protein [Methylobacillus caricis]
MPSLNLGSVWNRALPFAIYIALMAGVSIFEQYGPAGIDLRWFYGIKVTLVALVLWVLRKNYTELFHGSVLDFKAWLTAIAVGVLVFVAWINLDAPWMLLSEVSGGFNPGVGIEACILMATRIAGAALVVPLMEELFWRSFLMRWIQNQNFLKVAPRHVGWMALAVSSALFAIEHSLWFAGLVAGLAYGLLYIRSGKIWMPIIAHAVTNGVLGVWVIYTGNWHYW